MSLLAIPTDIPEGGIDGPQAEAMRHQLAIKELKAKEAELIERASKARLELRSAVRQWDNVKTDLLRVAGSAGLRDLLIEFDKGISTVESLMLEKAAAEVKEVIQAAPIPAAEPSSDAGKAKFRR